LIKSRAKKLERNKSNLVNMKLVLTNTSKVKREAKDLERVEKIISSKAILQEKDAALFKVKAKVNKAVIKESGKSVKKRTRILNKYLKRYANLGGPALKLKIKKAETMLEEAKKSKDSDKKAIIKKAMKRIM